MEPGIFRAYDIRGVYPKEINSKAAYLFGRSFVSFLGKKTPKIVVGRDARLSSPDLFKSLIKGITEAGGDVVDIGLSTTPMLYFSAGHYGFDGGISITASHNPPEFNGFKVVRNGSVPVSGKTGLKEIARIAKGEFKKAKKIGKVFKKSVIKDYVDFNLKGVDFGKIKPLKIVIDTANSVSGIVIPKMFEKTPCKIVHIFKELDGNFPNHSPDPHVKENIKQLKREVLKNKADLGIAFDGDGDRVIFVDERGNCIGGDLVSALMVKIILEKNPGEKIFYDIRSSKVVKEIIEKNKGKVSLGRLGHSFIKEKMRKDNIIFGGELNGHYYLRDHYFSEAPFYVVFRILEQISSFGPFSKIMKPYKRYFRSEEINFKVKDKKGKIREIENLYSKGKVSHLDGLKVDFSDWWFNVRLSNTENIMRLNLEANDRRTLKEKREELVKRIREA